MANYTNLNDLFTDMANAIRTKKDSTDTIIADNFPTEIESIRTGFDYNNTNVTVMPDYTFYNCEDLNNVDCVNLTSVGKSAFEDCKNLESVILYDGVESVGENAFKGCSEDLTIYCMEESKPDTWHEDWNPDNCPVVWCGSAIETWDISNTVTAKLYNNVNNDGKYLLVINGNGDIPNYSASQYDVNVGYVTDAPWGKYHDCISHVVICYGVTKIGNDAFSYLPNLISVKIPDSVIKINNTAFTYCTALESIFIPDSVNVIIDTAFRGCSSLISINIPNGLTDIRRDTFRDCANLTEVYIGKESQLTSIGLQAFANCTSLKTIFIPNSITSISKNAFYGCKNLMSIKYDGTKSQWKTITFGENWNYNTGRYRIYCTDGTIYKT